MATRLFGLVRPGSPGVARDILRRGGLLAASLLLSLMLVEGILRMVPGLLPEGARLRVARRSEAPLWYVAHPYIGHLHVADPDARAKTVRPDAPSALVDRWGFRNSWPWPERADIVAVGDSLTYSQTVSDDDAWTTLVARALPHSRVLNLGLIGGAPQQYLRIYETFGIARSPRVLLVGLFLGNDLWGAGEFDQWWKRGGHGGFPEFGRPEAQPGVWAWIISRVTGSSLGALVREIQASYQSGRFLPGRTLTLGDGGRVQLVPRLLAQMASRGHPGRRGFTLTLQTIERLHALGTQHHTRTVILFFPSKEEVYLPLVDDRTPDLAAPFLPELETRGIAYLDLGPLFRRRAAAGETLFWEVDGHPNPRGYSLIAEAVATYLKDDAARLGRARKAALGPAGWPGAPPSIAGASQVGFRSGSPGHPGPSAGAGTQAVAPARRARAPGIRSSERNPPI